MHLRTLFAAAVLLGCCSIAAATDLLVYRGTYREYQPTNSSRVLVGKCFVVLSLPSANQTAGQVGIVLYYVQPNGPDKGKKFVVTSPSAEVRFGGVTLGDGKVLRTISHAEELITEPAFADVGLYLRGVQTLIPIRPNGSNPAFTVSEPARLAGRGFSNAVTILGARYFERAYSLKQDEQRTLESNASNLDVTGALSVLVGYVKTLGYN